MRALTIALLALVVSCTPVTPVVWRATIEPTPAPPAHFVRVYMYTICPVAVECSALHAICASSRAYEWGVVRERTNEQIEMCEKHGGV